MTQVLIPSMDPRNERRTGTSEGLARRVAELERRIAQMESRPAPFLPYFAALSGGPFSVTFPPNSTTGVAFNVPIPGTYMMLFGGTAYATVVGSIVQEHYIDGVLVASPDIYANEAGSHKTLSMRVTTYNFTAAGTHYWWTRQAVGTTDGQDRANFAYWRVAALP